MAALPKYKNKPGIPKKEKKAPFKFDRARPKRKKKRNMKLVFLISQLERRKQ